MSINIIDVIYKLGCEASLSGDWPTDVSDITQDYLDTKIVCENGVLPDLATVVTAATGEVLADKKTQVLNIAEAKETLVATDKQQIKYLIRFTDLSLIASPTQDELDEKDAICAIKDRVNAINEHSAQLQADLDVDVDTDINAGWPE